MTDISMPQLGETVTEGMITRWFKAVGDPVAEDEVLFEVSTDKVDSEVPSPVTGVLTEILVPEGETVDVGERLCVVSEPGDATAPVPPPATESSTEPAPPPVPPPPPPAPTEPVTAPVPPPPPPAPTEPVTAPARPAAGAVAEAADVAGGGAVISPLVRRLMTEHGIEAGDVPGTGVGGRITRSDVERLIGTGRTTGVGSPTPAELSASVDQGPSTTPTARAGRETDVPLSNIRLRTGEHMVQSKATSPHAVTAVEVDYEAVDRVRRAERADFKAEEGFSLTYLPFIARAVVDALEDYPHLNASVRGADLVVHHYVNLSIAVDLDFEGLLAPVVRDADQKRMRAIAREVHDLAERARNKKLSADDIVGGTFTLTNAGSYGTHFVLPLINQPQVAILSTDGIKRRPVVVTDDDGGESIAIHSVGLLAMSWDHRAFDGAYAAAFLARVRDILETRDWVAEL